MTPLRLRPTLLGLITLATTAAAAPGQVTVGVQVPLPSPYLADWGVKPFIANLTVINGEGVAITATVTAELVEGRGTIVGQAPSDISGFPTTPSFFTTPQMARWSEMVFQPALAAKVNKTGRLPEGPYTLCVALTNVNAGGRPVANARGCSPTFTIAFPAPPVLLAPAHESTVTVPFPTFQWTPVVTPSVPLVMYRLRVVEMLPGQTALQAIDANVPVYEVTLGGLSSFIYPPSAFPLEVDHAYAWRVQALKGDPSFDDPPTPVGANDGRSEVFAFTKKTIGGPVIVATPALPAGPTPKPPPGPPPGAKPKPPTYVASGPLYNTMLFGKLTYTFYPGGVPEPKRLAPFVMTSYPAMQYSSSGTPLGGAVVTGMSIAGTGGGPQLTGSSGSQPALAGVKVRLVVRYRSGTAPVTATSVKVGNTTYSDVGDVLATATTGPDGSFSFQFHEDHPTGQIGMFSTVSWGSGDFKHTETNANVFRFYNLEVLDGHYLSPSDELTGDTADLGTLVSLVRSYALRVRVARFTTFSIGNQSYTLPTETLDAVRVQLLRLSRPQAVPKDEGDLPALNRPKETLHFMGMAWTAEVIGQTDSKNGGVVDFKRLVKNVGANDVYIVRAFTDSTDDGVSVFYHPAMTTYKNNWGLSQGAAKPWDAAHYNEQYNSGLKDSILLGMTPRPPRIAGRLERSDNAQPLAKGWVIITRAAVPATPQLPAVPYFLATPKVDSDGRFRADNVPPSRDGVPYTILAGAPGFKTENAKGDGPDWGQVWHESFQLDPDARVKARFVGESGEAVPASIKFGAGPLIAAKVFLQPQGSGNLVLMLPTGYSVDTTAASSAQPQAVHVEAYPGYFPLDTMILIKPGMNDLGTIKLISAKRRVTVLVRRGSATSQIAPAGAQPVPGAKVRVDALPGDEGVTGADGRVLLEFTGAGTGGPGANTVGVFIQGPDDSDYVPKTATCVAKETATPETCTVYLKPGTRVSGTVYAGTGTSAPVPNARVFVPGQDELETTTDAQGTYTLRRVPLKVKQLAAGKSASGLVGDLEDVTLQMPQTNGVDFHLTQYDDIDITQLLGFPLEVLQIATAPDGDGVIMSGALMAPANDALAAEQAGAPLPTVDLEFENVRVRAQGGGSKTAVPDGDLVTLLQDELLLRMHDSYKVRQGTPGTALVVRPRTPGQGAVYGAIEIRRLETFGTTTAGVTFITPQGQDAPVFLLMPEVTGTARTVLPSLTAGAVDPAPATGFNIGSASSGPARFRVNAGQGAQFNVDGDATQSFARADGVHFRATLHTAIPGVGDLGLTLPDLILKTGTGGLQPGASAQALQVKLHNWTLHVSGWSLSQAGLQFTKGEIRAPLIPTKPTSAVVFPFTGVTVLPTAIEGGALTSDAITLGGVVPFTPADGLKFTREGIGPWKISAPGGTIAGLPGWGSQSLQLDFWSIYSQGTPTFATPTGAKVRLYNTADFYIAGVNPGDGIVTMGGSLDLLPPPEANLPTVTAILAYAKNAQGQITPSLSGASWDEIDIGGPALKITDGTLDATGFRAGGYIRIPGYFQVATTFMRTPLTGTNKITAVPTPSATIAIGQLALTQVKGGASLNSPWSTAFDALLDIPNQLGGELHFDVAGANVAVGTAGVKVKNISTPFGSVAITLNMPEQRIEGSLEVNHAIATGAHAKGTAQLAISGKPGNRYWYFMLGADFELTQPYMAGTAALLIGDATLPPPLLSTFNEYSHRPLPPAFHTINGFFLAGKAPPPVIECPDLEIDVGVASASAGCDVYADVRFGVSFQDANTYFMGMGAGAEVWAKGGVSLGVCVSVSGSVKYDAELQGAYKSDGAWYVAGSSELSLNITVEYGVGAFDICLEDSETYSKAIGIDVQLGHDWVNGDGPHFTVYWK